MNNDLITVVIPVYNVEQFLYKCVNSVVKQTYTNLEIILVDDGSKDSSSRLCDQWKDKDSRIKVIHKENGGLSSARNAGIAAATGKYIGFVDSDDWIAEDMYETLYRLLVENDCQISVCGMQRTDESCFEEGEIIRKYSKKDYIKKILKVGTQDSNQYACNKLFITKLIPSDLYPVGLTDEDVEGTFKAVLRCDQVIETNKKCYFYRIENDSSITAPIFNERRLDFLSICDRVLTIAKREGDQQIIRWAQLFRYRADFGVLSRLAVMDISDEMNGKVGKIKKELLSELRDHFWELMLSGIPMSRKILIAGYCVNYDIVAFFLKRHGFKVK